MTAQMTDTNNVLQHKLAAGRVGNKTFWRLISCLFNSSISSGDVPRILGHVGKAHRNWFPLEIHYINVMLRCTSFGLGKMVSVGAFFSESLNTCEHQASRSTLWPLHIQFEGARDQNKLDGEMLLAMSKHGVSPHSARKRP